jgi:hypothetical protein
VTAAIGLRVYLITLRKKGDVKNQPFDSNLIKVTPAAFMKAFYASNKSAVQSAELERSWYFLEKFAGSEGSSKGYVHDAKTKKKNYRRKTTDVEEIPLFYEFWFPGDNLNHGFAVFQSFQGRSCIQLVMSKAQEEFAQANEGYRLNYQKLMPSDGKGGLFTKAPVKRLRLIRRDVSGDEADRYIGHTGAEKVDFELCISARRKSSLGNFGPLFNSLKNPAGVVLHEGLTFSEAVAEVRVGKRTRRIGVFGNDSDAGVIDITDDIAKGPDGHPTFESLAKESNEVLKEFYRMLSK